MKNFLAVIPFFIISCSGTKQSAETKKEMNNQAVLAESLQQKQKEGIDLFAKGAIPASWTLEIDFDRIIRFRSLDGTDYKSSPVSAVENAISNSSIYTTRANKGNMVITVYREACTDALSAEKFNKKITVDVDGKRYEGCGQYLANSSLNGKWTLEKVSGRAVTAAEFAKGLPELEFDIEGGKLSGHDGCNRINGSMEVQGNRIKFAGLASTKMACPGNKKENEFTQKLSNQVAGYFFSNGQLILYLIDDSTISFNRS